MVGIPWIRGQLQHYHRQGVAELVRKGPHLLLDLHERGQLGDIEFVEPTEAYTRKLLVGVGHNEAALLGMAWVAGYRSLVHGHGWLKKKNDPSSYEPSWCIDLVLKGEQHVEEFVRELTDDPWLFRLRKRKEYIVKAGECIVIDPRVTDIHRVSTPDEAESLHAYARSLEEAVVYVPEDHHAISEAHRMKTMPLQLD